MSFIGCFFLTVVLVSSAELVLLVRVSAAIGLIFLGVACVLTIILAPLGGCLL